MFYKRKTSKKKKTEDSITTPLNIYEVNEDQPKTEDEDETSKVTASPELLKAIEDELNKLGLKTETTLSSTGRGLVDKRKSLLLQTNPEEFGRPTVFNAPLKNVEERMELDYAIFARMQEEAAKLQKERKLKLESEKHSLKQKHLQELTEREATLLIELKKIREERQKLLSELSTENIYSETPATSTYSSQSTEDFVESSYFTATNAPVDLTLSSNQLKPFWNPESCPIVVDNCSGVCKAGFCTSPIPTCRFSSVVGRLRYREIITPELLVKDRYVGDAAQSKRGILKIEYPIEHGVIMNWSDMELIWDHCFYDQLRTNPEEHPVMLTEAVNNPKNNREKMAEIMFEKYGVPGLFISMQALLSLYACGRTSGLVVDIGDGVTHTATVFNGWLLPHSSLRMNLAGRDLTERMVRLLAERGYQFTTTAEREIVRDIKEKLSYVAFNYEEELANEELDSIADDSYTLPDGQVIYVGSESFRCTEALFKPSLVGMEDSGIHELTYKSIFKCDNEIRKDMYANIVLSGGTTMTPGLQERLTKELSLLAPPDCTVNLYAPADRNNSVWIGGAVLASLDSFLPMWVTSTDYSERGFVAVHEKCNVIE